MKKRCKSSGRVEWRIKACHQGKLEEWKPSDATTTMPENFETWVKDNAKKIAKMKNPPFFIRDNYQQGNVAKGLDTRITAELEQARLAAEAIKAKEPPTPQPITDYDNEVQVLRNVAAFYELDLAKMEQIRADGKDKETLRKEIDALRKESDTKQRKWDSEFRKAQKAVAALERVADDMKNEFGDTGGLADDTMIAEMNRNINAEYRATDYRGSIARLQDYATQANDIAKAVQAEIDKRRSAKPSFKQRQYTAMDDEQKLQYLIDRIDRLNYLASAEGVKRTWIDETPSYRAALASKDAKQIQKAIIKATWDETEISKAIDKNDGKSASEPFTSQMDDFKRGKQTTETDSISENRLAAMLGVSQAEAQEYWLSVNNFTYKWDYDIRAYQQGRNEKSKYGHTKKEIALYAKKLEEYLQMAPTWEGGVTYRGIHIDKALLAPYMTIGYEFDMMGTSSWTTAHYKAVSFASKRKGTEVSVIFECKNVQPRGSSIKGLSNYPGEHEILCSQTARWRVTGFKKIDDLNYEVKCEPCN